jgi:hypothetical protein
MANIAMRQVVIDDAARARAKEIMAYAAAHRESLTDLRNRLASGMPMKDPEKFMMEVRIGYNIAYTIEQRDRGWVQHISIYQATPRIMPHPPAVAQILTELFGIQPNKPVPASGRSAGVLGEALKVEQQTLPNGCIAVDLFYPFVFPSST